jgi:hypothetical protein
MQLDCLLQVMQNTPLLESISKTVGKVVETHGSIRMPGGAKRQCSSMELNALIQVTQDSLLLESVSKANSKVIQRQGSITMSRGIEH